MTKVFTLIKMEKKAIILKDQGRGDVILFDMKFPCEMEISTMCKIIIHDK
jgi:hypothetical protein